MRISLGLALLLAFHAVAGAAPRTPSAKPAPDSPQARARVAFLKGQQHYLLTEYDEALAAFTQAFRFWANPAFLYNIAQCHRALGHDEEAMRFYRSYLTAAPEDDPSLDTVRKAVAELEQKIVAQQKATAEAHAQEQARALEEARAHRALAEVTRARVLGLPTMRTAAEREVALRHARALRWAGVGAGLGGLVLVGAAIAPSLSARNAQLSLEADARANAAFQPAHEDAIHNGVLAAGLLYGIGGALVITGATLLGIGLAREGVARRAPLLGLAPLGDRGALVLVGGTL